ncbi:MAG TPA: competence/damage-inducible protein A [Firmicutes bacterium]|nr:competence/damage-inducible protein A [Bacillota bacterium]
MKGEIIAVGTELLLGQIVNTDASFLAAELAGLGISVYYQTAVGDNRQRIKEVFRLALERSELIVFSGGLGPTEDDLTKETVAETLGLSMVLHEEWAEHLRSIYLLRGTPMPANNLKQAYIPETALLLPNENGTAPGIYLEKEGKTVVLLPGPLEELKPMFRDKAVPLLRKKTAAKAIVSRVLKLAGISEALAAEKLAAHFEGANPTVAPLVGSFEVHLRITARGNTRKEAEELIAVKEREIREVVGSYIYGQDSDTFAGVIGSALLARGKTLVVAESCTGGRLADLITNTPGSSCYFLGGYTVYSEELKNKALGVEKKILAGYGAVSAETAAAMAKNAREKAGADYALAVTGLAGPDGGSPEKPVGLVYIGMAGGGFVKAQKFYFRGNREKIKGRAAFEALNMLWQELKSV